MRLLTFLMGVAVLFGVCTSAFAQAVVRPFEAASAEYYQKLRERKYDEIEKAAAESRRKNLTISDGQPKLAAIYGGLAGCLSSGCRNRLSEAEWQERLRLLSEWRKNDQKSVTAEIALAGFYLEHAYALRGQGAANTVEADAWPLFYESIETARGLLENASSGAKQDPGWYAAMLGVGVAQAWPQDKFNRIYVAGKKSVPQYIPLYFNASTYFAPRWHGSASDLRKFIEDVVDVTAPTLGETMYARLNWNLWTQSMFRDGQADWKKMKAGFQRVVTDFPDPWNINNFGKFACLAQDGPTLLEMAEKIGDRPIAAAWWGSADNYFQCVANARLASEKK